MRQKNQYFLKDKRAMIFKVYHVRNGYNTTDHVAPISPAPSLWCYSSQLSQTLVFVARTYSTDETRMFVFNPGYNVKTYDLIRYNGEWYQITRVDTTDDYKSDIFIYVKDCPRGSIPSSEEIHEYGWTPPTT